MKIGDYIRYKPKHDPIGKVGRIKSFSSYDGDPFVVYTCAGEWSRYTEYTAAKTPRKDCEVIENE